MARFQNILETIGKTPVVRIRKLFGDREVWVKLERANPGASIKDRIALAMIEDAEKAGKITPGKTHIIEPTSGNTGIGLALVAAVKGYQLTLVMPESMSVERRRILAAYGAKLELTPRAEGMKGAIAKAAALLAEAKDGWTPQQFENEANTDVHRRTTAQEVLADFPDGLDAIITGVGTGGHITALAQVLKPKFPQLKIYAVEPVKSPVLSGGAPGPHPLQGLGAGFIPRIMKKELLDGVIQVDEKDAYDFTRRAAKEEGLFLGVSSGAALAAVKQKLAELPQNARVLTFNYDTGERYLSIDGLFPLS